MRPLFDAEPGGRTLVEGDDLGAHLRAFADRFAPGNPADELAGRGAVGPDAAVPIEPGHLRGRGRRVDERAHDEEVVVVVVAIHVLQDGGDDLGLECWHEIYGTGVIPWVTMVSCRSHPTPRTGPGCSTPAAP